MSNVDEELVRVFIARRDKLSKRKKKKLEKNKKKLLALIPYLL